MIKVLQGVRVVEQGTFITGPAASMLLADLGADVVKVELPGTGDPFRAADAAIAELSKKSKVIVLDFHAEASSEKRAMAFYVDGRISFQFGTHTHVPTADPWVMAKGTGYVTDVGMNGPDDSIIGMKTEDVLKRFLSGHHIRMDVGKRWPVFRSVVCDIDEATGKARSVERADLRLTE